MRKFLIKVNGIPYEVEVEELAAGAAPAYSAPQAPVAQTAPAALPTTPPVVAAVPAPKQMASPAGATEIKSPLPGTILSVNVSVGDHVSNGDVLLLIEAMKMENEIMSPIEGTVLSVAAIRDTIVNPGDLLIVIG